MTTQDDAQIMRALTEKDAITHLSIITVTNSTHYVTLYTNNEGCYFFDNIAEISIAKLTMGATISEDSSHECDARLSHHSCDVLLPPRTPAPTLVFHNLLINARNFLLSSHLHS